MDLLLDMSIIELYNEVACYLAILRSIPAKKNCFEWLWQSWLWRGSCWCCRCRCPRRIRFCSSCLFWWRMTIISEHKGVINFHLTRRWKWENWFIVEFPIIKWKFAYLASRFKIWKWVPACFLPASGTCNKTFNTN